MMRFIWIIGIYVHSFMQQCMPSNLLLNRIRRRQGLKWGVPAMLLAVPYLLIAVWCSGMIEHGGPGWLHLVNMICIWNALKFIVMGPYSVIQLLRWRRYEAVARKQAPTRESSAGLTSRKLTHSGQKPNAGCGNKPLLSTV